MSIYFHMQNAVILIRAPLLMIISGNNNTDDFGYTSTDDRTLV